MKDMAKYVPKRNQIDFKDIVDAAKIFVEKADKLGGIDSQKEWEKWSVQSNETADWAEVLVIFLVRFYNNESMVSYIADEVAAAIKEGY